jgi:tetratricopeptide (TPR) repeat protein
MNGTRLRVALLASCAAPIFASTDAHARDVGTWQGGQGKIVAVQGRVEQAQAAHQDVWVPASLQQLLFIDDRVRTFAASRAAVLFVDETQVRLNADATLIVKAVHDGQGAPSVLDLVKGEAWFRTKNPKSGLTVKTAAASAAMRGTEIDLRVDDDGASVLVVVEGAALFFNDAGAIVASAGEEARARPGEAPTKRVILNPEDAVQWALYYPVTAARRDVVPVGATGAVREGFARLASYDRAGALNAFSGSNEAWARIGASQAHLELGQLGEARGALDPLAGARLDPELSVTLDSQRAALALAEGDATRARQLIANALAIDAQALRPLLLLSTLELTQNKKKAARAAADRALRAHPDSVGALVTASEVAQASFELPAARRHLDRSLQVDPNELRARINRARLRFGSDDPRGAKSDISEAVRLSPDDPQALSLQGFIKLAAGDVAGAEQDLKKAATLDREFGEPHLGLGLAAFRRRSPDLGLEEMLTATLLEPKVSLYQSYLGKAYYQLRRFDEGLAALDSAKRLDPRDPTPWLYASLFRRDQNQQAAALEELREAIARNDDRAVYRSRLLLDLDNATKNVTLAELYRQLGFEAWGAFEALNSLDTDITNASAHLFLARTYGTMPDRTQALTSELLQYFLNAPVNRNTFNGFNEYTALLEQPYAQLSVSPGYGSKGWLEGTVVTRSGNERFAHYAFVGLEREDGGRPTKADTREQLFAQAKISMGSRDDLFASFTRTHDNEGQSPDTVALYGESPGPKVRLRRYGATIDPNLTTESDLTSGVLGYKHQWRTGSALTAAVTLEQIATKNTNPSSLGSACSNLPLEWIDAQADWRTEFAFDRLSVQAQQVSRVGRHQLVGGVSLFRQHKKDSCAERIYFPELGEDFSNTQDTSSLDDHDYRAYLRDEIRLFNRLQAVLGIALDEVQYEDPATEKRTSFNRFSPQVGLAARVGAQTVLRAAALRNVASDFVGSKISPSTVSGLVIERNEYPTTIRDEASVAVDHGLRRVFLSGRLLLRKSAVPALKAQRLPDPEAETQAGGAGASLNWTLGRRWSLFADDLLLRTDADVYKRTDNVARLGLTFLHEHGLRLQAVASHFYQRFGDTEVAGLPRSSHVLVDVDAAYEFAAKRGRATLQVTNALGQEFDTILEGISIAQIRPERRVYLIVQWRF